MAQNTNTSTAKDLQYIQSHCRTPAETLNIVKPFLKLCGITRIADITRLDRIGIPVFSCIRPCAEEGAITVYNGKGLDEDSARVSAVMEGVERYSAEVKGRKLTFGSYNTLCKMGAAALDPETLNLPRDLSARYNVLSSHDLNTAWYPCRDLTKILESDKELDELNEEQKNDQNNDQTLIPACAVFHPLTHDDLCANQNETETTQNDTESESVNSNCVQFFRTSTNGLASGNNFYEATMSGLCEVIERDSWSIAEATRISGSVIDKSTISDPILNSLLKKFDDAGIDIILRNITSDLKIPTIAAVCDDFTLKDPALLCIGMGTSLSPVNAAIRAITEVAQSRATQIHGAREDATEVSGRQKLGYEITKRLNKRWFLMPDNTDSAANSSTYCDFQTIAPKDYTPHPASPENSKADLQYIVGRLKECDIDKIYVCDLSLLRADISVVKVITPKLETFAIDSERMGKRCKDAGRNCIHRTKP